MDPRIRIQGAKYQNLKKKPLLILKPKSELLEKRDYKTFLISEWLSSYNIKVSEKKKKKFFDNFALLKKKSGNIKECS